MTAPLLNGYWNLANATELPAFPPVQYTGGTCTVAPASCRLSREPVLACRTCIWSANEGAIQKLGSAYASCPDEIGSANFFVRGPGEINGKRISTINPPCARLKAETFPP